MQLVHGGNEVGIGLEPERGDEARRPQHAQGIVNERHLGLERSAKAARDEVAGAVERVDELRLRKPERHRVDREVAPRQVGFDVVGVLDLGLAALGAVHVGSEGRDLDPGAVLLAADGPEALPLEPHAVGPVTHEPLDLVGPGVGGEVDVLVGEVEQGVPDAAADEVGLVAGRDEPPGQLLDRQVRVEERPQARRDRGHGIILATIHHFPRWVL